MLFVREIAGSGFALYEGKRVRHSVRSSPLVAREIAMSLFIIPSFDTHLCQGGLGGANRSDRRPCRSVLFAPMPRGTDTARPADRS